MAISVLVKVLIRKGDKESEKARILYSDLRQVTDRTKSELQMAEVSGVVIVVLCLCCP